MADFEDNFSRIEGMVTLTLSSPLLYGPQVSNQRLPSDDRTFDRRDRSASPRGDRDERDRDRSPNGLDRACVTTTASFASYLSLITVLPILPIRE